VRTIPQQTKTLTLTEAAVLCLLAVEGERSGYELLKHATHSVGYVWAPAKSQLYTVLPRLADAGLVSRRSVSQSDRPDKQLHRVTEGGERALEAWLATIDPGNLDALQLKVFYGGLMPKATLIEHLETYRDHLRDTLALFDRIGERNTNRGHEYYHRLMLRYGQARARASLRWADEVLADVRRKR
jgi:DNA-binding PadR family transcriptional regulator